jgi:hypothetical protein
MTAPSDPARRVSITVPAWVAALRDPGVRAALVLLAAAVAGFVMLALAWRGAAATVWVPLQVPWLVSGGVAGLALVAASLGAWTVHLGRRADAAHRAEWERFVRDAVDVVEDLRASR